MAHASPTTLAQTAYRLVCDGCCQETPIETARIVHYYLARPRIGWGYSESVRHVGLCPACDAAYGEQLRHGDPHEGWAHRCPHPHMTPL